MTLRRSFYLTIPLLLVSSCSEPPKAVKKEVKKAEPVTGQKAFHNMYIAARQWSPDVQIMRITSIPLDGQDNSGKDGKAWAWSATFISASKGKAKMFTYSAIEGEGNLHKGVFGNQEESYNPRGSDKPYPVAALKLDTDKAWEIASVKGADYAKKNPDKPVVFLAELSNRSPDVTWRVLWGSSASTANFSVLIDASTGKFLEVLH